MDIDNVYKTLQSIGLDVIGVKRGRPEEDTSFIVNQAGESLGLIEIQNSPIQWVNVVEKPGNASQGTSLSYINIYLISSTKAPFSGYHEAKSMRVRNIPIIGHVKDIRWKSKIGAWDDFIQRIDEDVSLKQVLIRLRKDIEVRSFPKQNCWGIWSRQSWFDSAKGLKKISREEVGCYETTARHLLELGKY
jgi:hypothetical protein